MGFEIDIPITRDADAIGGVVTVGVNDLGVFLRSEPNHVNIPTINLMGLTEAEACAIGDAFIAAAAELGKRVRIPAAARVEHNDA